MISPSKGDLVRIKNLPRWVGENKYINVTDKYDPTRTLIINHILEVKDLHREFPNTVIIHSELSESGGWAIPPEYYEIVFTV